MANKDLGLVVGPQGPSGPQGPAGPKGDTGDTGPNLISTETDASDIYTAATTPSYLVGSNGTRLYKYSAAQARVGSALQVAVNTSGQSYTLAGLTSGGTGNKEVMSVPVSSLPTVPNAENANKSGGSNTSTFALPYGTIVSTNDYFGVRVADQELAYSPIDGYWWFRPSTNALSNCGRGPGNHFWKTVYATDGTINTSDRNRKTDIEPIESDNRYLELFDKMKPVKFRWKDEEGKPKHDRVHTGFIAQDIEESMEEIGLSNLELSALCKDLDEDEEGNPIEGKYLYSLRYTELIALNTAAIKRLESKVATLEKRIEELESKGE